MLEATYLLIGTAIIVVLPLLADYELRARDEDRTRRPMSVPRVRDHRRADP
ncbi:hypothetical protein [Modestobacter marinus]|uniref:hypothetical protein n=1 Tax=Modestobacter marinus TaxID=477641 RepID=UPI001C9400DC|nr:hypothetical protein [Modestobacter marinus]